MTYTMTVTTPGTGDGASALLVSNALPAGTVFLSASTTHGTVTTPGVGSNGLVSAALGVLAKGTTAKVSVVVRVTAATGTVLTDRATVSATTPDSNSSNNSVTQNTPVTGQKGNRRRGPQVECDLFRSVVETQSLGATRPCPEVSGIGPERSPHGPPGVSGHLRTPADLWAASAVSVASQARATPSVICRAHAARASQAATRAATIRAFHATAVTFCDRRPLTYRCGAAGTSRANHRLRRVNAKETKEFMMNARLLVAVALPFLFVASGSARVAAFGKSGQHHHCRRRHSSPDGRFNHCLHQHARQLPTTLGITPSTPDCRRRDLLHRLHDRRNLLRAPPGDREHLHRYLSDTVAGRTRKGGLRQQSAPHRQRARQPVRSVPDEP